eukprot:76153-Rhodomonas_salina.2
MSVLALYTVPLARLVLAKQYVRDDPYCPDQALRYKGTHGQKEVGNKDRRDRGNSDRGDRGDRGDRDRCEKER